MFCQKCGSENPDDSLFCVNCGLKFVASEKQEVVSTPVTPQIPNIIIQQQQQQQQQQPVYGKQYTGPPSDKSATVALILCLLGFIGLGGFHEFYAGRVGMGILFFLTFGLFFIGTLVHTISILSGNYRDVVGAPITKW